MLTVFSSNIYLYPESKKLPIDMRDLCESLRSKFSSLHSDDNWYNASVHDLFDGSFFYALMKKVCEFFCVDFHGHLLA